MKQNITTEQIAELTEKEKQKLSDWIFNRIQPSVEPFVPLLSIGQMIEFLDNSLPEVKGGDNPNIFISEGREWSVVFDLSRARKEYTAVELCDALWEAVKEVLK